MNYDLNKFSEQQEKTSTLGGAEKAAGADRP